MLDFLLTTPYCAMLLYKLLPRIQLKIPNSCAFSFCLFSFIIYSLFIRCIYKNKNLQLRRKASVRRREKNEKSIRKAFKKIVQYYCCCRWCGLISRPFHYLTKKKKKNQLKKKTTQTKQVNEMKNQEQKENYGVEPLI